MPGYTGIAARLPVMDTDLHIIVSCTDRKRAPVPPELHLREVHEASGHRARHWWSRLVRSSHPTRPAETLYAGDHWRVARELPTLGAAARLRTRLWVASAGYGLIPSDAPIRPYSATFTPRHADSVVPGDAPRSTPALLRQWWLALTHQPGPLPDIPRSLHALAQATPHARLLVVASPFYISALEEDLVLAARALRRPEHLLVISTPGTTSRGALAPHWVPSRARLRTTLGGALSSLHVRLARDLLRRTRDGGAALMDAPGVREYYERLFHRSVLPSRFERTPMTDDEVLQFIARESRAEKRSWSAALRRLRDGGRACEQQRFRRLFHQSQERS